MSVTAPDLAAARSEVGAAEQALTEARSAYLAAPEGDEVQRAAYLAAARRVEAAHDAVAILHLGDAQPLVMTLTPGSDEAAAHAQWMPSPEPVEQGA